MITVYEKEWSDWSEWSGCTKNRTRPDSLCSTGQPTDTCPMEIESDECETTTGDLLIWNHTYLNHNLKYATNWIGFVSKKSKVSGTSGEAGHPAHQLVGTASEWDDGCVEMTPTHVLETPQRPRIARWPNVQVLLDARGNMLQKSS